MSAPITIPVSPSRASFNAVATPSFSPSSGGLYVPVHKRTGSSSSSRSSSSTRSDSEHVSHPLPTTTIPTTPSLIYSRDTLLELAHSPLARLSIETRDALRTTFPEIVTNRKQRKALEYYHNHPVQNPARVQLVPPRRTRPVSRIPERRRNAAKVVDDASWRGRRPTMVVLPNGPVAHASVPIAV